MSRTQDQQPSAPQPFFRGLWEVVAFALTAVGALASVLVGHWDGPAEPYKTAPGPENRARRR